MSGGALSKMWSLDGFDPYATAVASGGAAPQIRQTLTHSVPSMAQGDWQMGQKNIV